MVLSVVLTVHTWHSMKLLDLGKCGDEVTWLMWLCWRNCVSSSEVNGRTVVSVEQTRHSILQYELKQVFR